jgi:hypothetical protein
MPQFYITNESTEDTFDSTDDLQSAIRIAKEVARSGQVGDPVSIEHDGKTVKQFILAPDGRVQEQVVAICPTAEGGSDAA